MLDLLHGRWARDSSKCSTSRLPPGRRTILRPRRRPWTYPIPPISPVLKNSVRPPPLPPRMASAVPLLRCLRRRCPPKQWRGSSPRATTPLLRRRRGPLSGPRPRRLLQADRLRHTAPRGAITGEPDHPPLPVPPPVCPRLPGAPRREDSRRSPRSCPKPPHPTQGIIPRARSTEQMTPSTLHPNSDRDPLPRRRRRMPLPLRDSRRP